MKKIDAMVTKIPKAWSVEFVPARKLTSPVPTAAESRDTVMRKKKTYKMLVYHSAIDVARK